MAKRIPPEAFGFYLALGPGRSYEGVAQRYQVSKRAVVKRATRESWQQRIVEAEAKARQTSLEQTGEGLEAVNRRHLRLLRALQGKALEGLSAASQLKPADCIRALYLAVKGEREILTAPGGVDRNAEARDVAHKILQYVAELDAATTDIDPGEEPGAEPDGDAGVGPTGSPE